MPSDVSAYHRKHEGLQRTTAMPLRQRDAADQRKATVQQNAQQENSSTQTATAASDKRNVFLAVTLILTGCCSNVMTLELITKRDPGAGNLITLAQFAFVAAQGFLHHWIPPFGLKPRKIPMLAYIGLTVLFFTLSVMNNKALDYDISVPLHTIFRSCSLAASLFIGLFFFQKKYSKQQILACVLVTIGICTATLADANMRQSGCCGDSAPPTTAPNTTEDATPGASGSPESPNGPDGSSWWFLGILILTVALLLSALLGHLQNLLYVKFGREWRENLFYSHLLALPGFLLLSDDISTRIVDWTTQPPVPVALPAGITLQLPLFALLALNIFFQFVCIRGVFLLTSTAGTLTTTLTITFRKFVSLLISIAYFQNPFTPQHWIGTVMVFAGVLMYAQAPKPAADSSATQEAGKKAQ